MDLLPAILADSQEDFERKLRCIESDAAVVHVDVLDRTFVPSFSWCDPITIGAIKTPVQFEIHLMVENPVAHAEAWKQSVPSLVRAIFHVELDRPTGAILEHLQQSLKLETGIALNPETPPEEAHHLLHRVNEVLVMGVQPGASGQTFHGESILQKIHWLHTHLPETIIGVDGGVTETLLPELVRTGASRVCAANMIFESADPAATIKRLHAQFF